MKRFFSVLICFAMIFSLAACDSIGSLFSGSKQGVMIYEMYTSGGYSSGEVYSPYQYSYAVLYNAGKEAVSLDGWTISFCKTGTEEAVVRQSTTLSGSIEPDSFFVVRGSSAPDAFEPFKGEDLPFDIDAVGSFSPDRKQGIVALCNNEDKGKKKITKKSSFVEDYLVYGEDDGTGANPQKMALGITVKRVLRRVSFANTGNNSVDFQTVNIVDTPAKIIRYTKGIKPSDISGAADHTQSGVALSHSSGYYDSEFTLTLTTDLAGDAKIYYTLDGSMPISHTGTVSPTALEYTGEIRIYDRTGDQPKIMNIPGTCEPRTETDTKDLAWPPKKKDGESDGDYQKRLNDLFTTVFKGNVVRAAAVNSNKVVTKTESHTFFVSKKSLAERYNMPMISIITDATGLYDANNGIFMPKNRELRGNEGQRPIYMQFFEKDGTLAFTESAKMQLNGGFTRIYPQKALRINMSNEKFNYDLTGGEAKDINGKAVTYFDRFVLRAGGNDWSWGGMRDPFYQKYCSQLGTFDTQASQPVSAFINGEFWGIYYLSERLDEYYVSARYNIDRNDVAMVEGFFALKAGRPGDEHELIELRGFCLDNDMSLPENYKKFSDLIDEDSYIDYFICELYCGNTDWPHNNLVSWKNRNKNAKENTKWRMIMQDVDWAFNLGSGDDHIDWILNSCDAENGRMFSKLMKNSGFKSKFISRFDVLLNDFFVPSKMISVLDTQYAALEAGRGEQLHRWGFSNDIRTVEYERLKKIISERNGIMRTALNKIK